MPEFEGIPLFRNSQPSAGAWFRLAKSPKQDGRVQLAGGVEVEVRKGVRAVVIRGLGGSSHEEVFASAPEVANRALDLLTLKLRPGLALADVRDLHAIWWQDGRDESVVRFSLSHTMKFAFQVNITALGPDGEPIRGTPITPQWRGSMRYFRMSEVADDLLDSFRNTYLAIESLLSEIEPMKQGRSGRGWESEEVWFKRALRTADALVPVADFAPFPDGGDPVHAIWLELCEHLRHAVFHAKTARNPLLPQDGFSRSRIVEARLRYARFYLALVGKFLFGSAFSSGGSGLSVALRRIMAEAQAGEMKIGIADDPTPATDGNEPLSPSNGVVRTLDGESTVSDDLLTVKAEARVEDLSPLVGVGRFGAVHKDTGQALVFDGLEGTLMLSGFDQCQVVLSLGSTGDPGLKSDFAT